MTFDDNRSPGLAEKDRLSLIQKMREKLAQREPGRATGHAPAPSGTEDSACDFSQFADVKKIAIHKAVAKQWGIDSLYFLCHEGVARDTTVIGGKTCLNFSTYDYLGINGSEALNAAARAALEKYGSSSSGSRPTSGERPPHRELERALADLHGAQDCVVFVSGHATNVWTIYQLFKKRDVVFYDSLSHNSIIQGAQISGAVRLPFSHNDLDALEELLAAERHRYHRALIVTEGLFSMDGDIPDLPRLAELKKKYGCFLMVDEAHALGVLGPTGRGLAEHYGMDPGVVDIWMGTLSKTLCGCGGYVAGRAELVECLKYLAPGFLYSVGMSPPLAAASREAVAVMLREPERVRRLQETSRFFLDYARQKGLDTGRAQGYAVVPIMVGGSVETAMLAARLFHQGVYVIPIIFPVVEEKAARLRFFLSCSHTKAQVRQALDLVAKELPLVRQTAAAMAEDRDNDAGLDGQD
ncbi:aminotransferase class I/II-fold pyridoxal phosphate-dependent enzyme [Desulfovibrio sulfodismutans]|uniref:Aminotransferase class I/II-fold pyridoxal phosphate-dependent enzyme n=1 Tax=Desulfolutivibrio sulfodismutans TaxID=63561 RepID=A0A7K3NJW0_9BACT|nr:aminotransferase class I/II-fold pyridoxal phosphate-dependent enzyme [Desulfolutivibrio sulfodismutans]NDY56491.1 aminotransferase class I/II-fold pyridoxal phosphate-dependent enzyme [Desulfolutivibrio sulfodismutans]QLA12773.1 aminotransferase class I/II-fold pyridoxal phosphate-dependent enzyme [Desulfolutivibrio sulfodismutans DSM 3696]